MMSNRARRWNLILAALCITSCSTDADPATLSGDGGQLAVPADAQPESGGSPRALELLLSETDLYADISIGKLAAGVQEFRPAYFLWTDSATKRRFVRLPPGESIDSSDMDYWRYPIGMTLWKEFSRENSEGISVRLETRMMRKVADGDWQMIAYVWRDDLSDADAAPNGLSDARGTQHEVPSETDCRSCHRAIPDNVLGFTAIQLSHDYGGVDLQQLIDEGRLSPPPTQGFSLPGDPTAQLALGYLHANCGHCHNPLSPFSWDTVTDQLSFWLETASISTVTEPSTFQSVGFRTQTATAGLPPWRIAAGNADDSSVVYRMATRDPDLQMPQLGTEVVDTAGLAAVTAWVESLQP